MPNNVTIDWEGLARAFNPAPQLDFETPYPKRVGTEFDRTPGKGVNEFTSPNLTYDIAGLWNSFEFTGDDWVSYWEQQKAPLTISKDADGFNIFDFSLNTIPKFLGSAVYEATSLSTDPIGKVYRTYKAWTFDPKEFAQDFKKNLKERVKDNDPSLIEEIYTGKDEGLAQNIGLLFGTQRITTDLRARNEREDAAILAAYKRGELTDDEFVAYRKLRSDVQGNTSLAFDLAAGITNSVMIMGELYATSGASMGATVTTTGLKIGSKAWFATYGKALWESGKASWKVMGPGANIQALGDATTTIREENLDLGPAMVEITGNLVKKNIQAWSEGASERLLQSINLGSVPLKKWLGIPIQKMVNGVKKDVYLNAREIKGMLSRTTDVAERKLLTKALEEIRNNREDIVRLIAKNTGKKMVNGLFLETATEQTTDMLQDAFEGTNTNVFNLLSSDEEIRTGALKNLIVEMGVGLTLGVGMGLSDIWTRKPMEELKAKYGEDVANTVAKVMQTPDAMNKMAAIIVDSGAKKGAIEPNAENVAKVALDLGSKTVPTGYTQDANGRWRKGGKFVKAPEGIAEVEGDVKAFSGARLNLPADMATTIETVDNMAAPNVLDFPMILGQKQLKQMDQNTAAQMDAQVQPDSFFQDASPETIHAMSSVAYDHVLTNASTSGLMSRINWLKDSDLELKRDLAVGIAMDFDDLGWGYVRHKYSTNSDIDFNIEEAQKIAKSDIELNPPSALDLRLHGPQTVKRVQEKSSLLYKEAIALTKHALVNEQAVLIGGSVDYIPPVDMDEEAPTINLTGGEAIYDPNLFAEEESGSAFMDDMLPAHPFDQGFKPQVQDERPPYKVVAHRNSQTGVITEGHIGQFHKDMIYGSRTKLGLEADFNGEWGYVDWEGNFVTRDDVRFKYGEMGETTAMFKAGLLAKDTKFESQIPDVTFKFQTYDSVLPKVEETTFLELAKWLENNSVINELTKEVLDMMMPVIANRRVVLTDMGPKWAGGTDPATLESQINTKAIMYKPTSAFDTLVHEGLHSWLGSFMDQDTDLARIFNGKVTAVANTVKSVLNAPEGSQILKERWTGSYQELQAYKKLHNELLRKALSQNPNGAYEEFLDSALTDTQAIRWVTDRVLVGGPARKLTGWKKLWATIAGVLQKEASIPVMATRKLQEIIEEQSKLLTAMNAGTNKQFNVALARENKRLANSITSSYMEWETYDENEDDQDDYQVEDDIANEDENKIENQSVSNFVAFMAMGMDLSEGQYRDHVRTLTYTAYQEMMTKFNDKNYNIINRKLERSYSNYKHIWGTFGAYREQFLKRQYLNIVNKEAKVSAIMIASSNFDEAQGETVTGYEVRLVKGTYTDGKGAKRNSFKETIALENFIPKFEEMLGLPPKTFHVVFLDGFESVKDGQVIRRNSFDRLRKEFFHDYAENSTEPITGHLADWLWSSAAETGSAYDYLYLGNFAKKNTLPVLAFSATPENKQQIREALHRFEVIYANAAVDAFGDEYQPEPKESRRMAQTSRALLESLWFNHKFEKNEAGQWTLTDPKVAQQDWNKIMKRATKWLVKRTNIVLTPDEIKNKFGNRDLSGIKLTENDAEIRVAVLNSQDNKTVTLNFMGTEVTVPLSDLLLNELGTPIGDGSSVYIIGQLDDLYLTANGALKSGIIKNVYGSKVGENPIFIKHAMHGVHKDSILGQWMINNNLGMITFDESMKEGKDHYTPISGADFNDTKSFAMTEANALQKGQEVVMTLKLSSFQRIKEIENVDTLGGSTKQLINGTAFSDLFNTALQEAVKKSGTPLSLNDILLRFNGNQSLQAAKWFQRNATPAAFLDTLRNIIAEPKSPLEISVSNIWGNLLEPKEGQTEQDILNKYAGAFDHAHTAEALKNRLQHRMAQLLGGKTAGQRGGLTPNFGYLNHKRDIEPIVQHYNLGEILVSEHSDNISRDVLEAALPEAGLLTIVRKLQDASRAESRAHTDLIGHEKARRLRSLQDYRARLIQQIKDLKSERIASIMEGSTKKLAIHRLINWNAPEVLKWQNDYIWGTEYEEGGVKLRKDNGILNVKNGRLRGEWKILPEDIANNFGIKAGDWMLDDITPTDSPLGLGAFRVAAISKINDDGKGRKVSDRNAVVLNSEWSQTINGKDHDADDVSGIPFHPDYWSLKDYKALVNIARQIPSTYIKHIKQETIDLLEKNHTVIKLDNGQVITSETLKGPQGTKLIFGEPMVKEKYSLLLNGAPSQHNRRVFPLMGNSFIQLDSLYLFSPAPIINERLYHTGSSAINMRSTNVPLIFISKDGKLSNKGSINGEEVSLKLDFVVRNKHWMRTHINHQDMTHADVDFPNKTTRLGYNSDPAVLAEQFWGVKDEPITVAATVHGMRPMYQAIRDFQKLLFEDSFNLARRRDTELYEKLGYYETINQLVRAQNRLNLLATNDKVGLKNLYLEHYKQQITNLENRYRPNSPKFLTGQLQADQKLKFIEGFIDNMEVDDVYAYPLFNTIRNLDPNTIPQPGNTYKDHLINQVVATGESINLYPEVRNRYETAIMKAPQSFFVVGESATEKLAKESFRLMGITPSSKSAGALAAMLRDKSRMNERIAKARPANLNKLKAKLAEFEELNAKVGRPYEAFARAGKAYNVDGETIAFSRIPREFDYFANRAQNRGNNTEAYYDKQLRMVREEVVTMMHAFDVEPDVDFKLEQNRTVLPEATEERRTAHQRVYPLLWKTILENPFLFFDKGNVAITLQHESGNAVLQGNGRGELSIKYNGTVYNHAELKADTPVYKLLTERNGFWEGIADTSMGVTNRSEMRKLIRMARNLSMDTRYELVKDFVSKRLYGPNTPFTSMDQTGFWLSLLSQTSYQAQQDNKAKSFIVNQSAYDPKRPMKYQNNHLALDLMAAFEEQMVDAWLQLYSYANKGKERMLFEDQPHMGPQESLRHYFSSYRDQIEAMSKDADFISFYKRMRNQDWKAGLEEIRTLLKSTVMLKALSENGVFYEDMVKDINTLSDPQFYAKYKGVDVEDIKLSLDRYMGKQAIDSFIRQRLGESDTDFRTKNTIVSMYWSLNGHKKRQMKAESKLGAFSRFFSGFIGYDMVTLLGEKKTEALTPRDQEIGMALGPDGPIPFTTNEVMIGQKTHATRTWMGVGKSSTSMYKTQQANRTLNLWQTEMSSQISQFEDLVKLSSNVNFRNKWRTQYAHRTKSGIETTHHTNRTRLISKLLDMIPESDTKQLEIARKDVFELAEGLKSKHKIWIEEKGNQIVYKVQLNKVYSYTNLDELINKHLGGSTPQKQLELIGALDIRLMYDVMVPKYLDSILKYLVETRDNLNEATSFTAALEVDRTIQKYQDMYNSLGKRIGDYMPHMFPESEYRLLWMSGFLKHTTERIKDEIRQAKLSGSDPIVGALDPENPQDAQKILDMAYARAESEYTKLSHDWNRGSVIPNFLPRQFADAEGYTKSDPTIHLNYNTHLIEGLKKDVLKADFLLYQKEAREAGERTSVMELTRQWYARQVNDEELNSQVIASDEVTPGMQVHFYHPSFLIRGKDPTLTYGTGVVNGIVRKVTADEVILDLDIDKARWEIKQDLARWTALADRATISARTSNASSRQQIILQNLLSRGFLNDQDFEGIDLSILSMLDAADLIVKGLRRAYKNPEAMTRYKWTDIWTSDARGEKVTNSIRRYARSGALETIRTRERELHNLQLMGGRYDGVIPVKQYNLIRYGLKGADFARKGLKRITSLDYMGMASAFKARAVNQLGATVNNLVDAPIYNYSKWKEGMEIWDRIKHGKIELMDPDDAKLYKTVVSLGLVGENNILAIALEAANIKAEDMLVQDAKPAALKWLFNLWQDAVGFKEAQAEIQALKEQQLKTANYEKKMVIGEKILRAQKTWQAKMEGILAKEGPLTDAEKAEAWKKVEELQASGKITKMNIAQEQGISIATATRMVGSVAWKSFYTSNLGVGFQAKAERLRIPAFFIGYTTALDMGFDENEAIQFGINSIEVRHAFYGTASKQFGANTEMGGLLFQYAQYQYNALSKAIRIMHEAIPQMLRLSYERPENVSRIKHLANMFSLVQTQLDSKGNALKRGEVTLKEINLLHGIAMKVLWTGAAMQLGTRIFYGITNFQDPVGQTMYKTLDYIITLLQSGFDPGDDDDKERLVWAIQDGALITGLLYKYQLQALGQIPEIASGNNVLKTFADTYYKGRAEDTFNFLWRTSNTMQQVAYELGIKDTKLKRKERTYFDVPWLTDQFFTGIKIMGWSPADNAPGTYEKTGFFGSRSVDAFTAGRYVETNNKGISGFGQGKSRSRFSYLFDPQSYVPFLDRIITGK